MHEGFRANNPAKIHTNKNQRCSKIIHKGSELQCEACHKVKSQKLKLIHQYFNTRDTQIETASDHERYREKKKNLNARKTKR